MLIIIIFIAYTAFMGIFFYNLFFLLLIVHQLKVKF